MAKSIVYALKMKKSVGRIDGSGRNPLILSRSRHPSKEKRAIFGPELPSPSMREKHGLLAIKCCSSSQLLIP